MARTIRRLQNKLGKGNTTMVSIPTSDTTCIDLMGKREIEQAILQNNKKKFEQSFHTPFYQQPLLSDMGFKGLTSKAKQVLLGVCDPPGSLPPKLKNFIQHLQIPEQHKRIKPTLDLSLEQYNFFWNHAKVMTSAYPDALSFATMKAGAQDGYMAEVEWLLARIPLLSGYSLKRWQNFLDVMVMKKSGLTLLSSLSTIVLFPEDCNYIFKHIGRGMMTEAKKRNILAPEQYGSRKHHRAIDLAINETLTYDLLHQLKRPGAICSNNAKS